MRSLFVLFIFLLSNFADSAEDKNLSHETDLYLVGHAKFLADQLIKRGVIFFDPIVYENIQPSLEGFQAGFKRQLGNSFQTIPSDKLIVQYLQNLVESGERFFPNPQKPLADCKVGKQALQTKVPRISFIQKWREISRSRDFNPDFYEDIYEVLSQEEIIQAAEFVDPTDSFINGLTNSHELKKDYLIILLASIKNPKNNKELTFKVKAGPRTQVSFPTHGNNESWFAEKRYKLYRIWQGLSQMNFADKATLLSNLLHAGKHCSVAKRWQIDDSYKLFSYQDFEKIQKEKGALAKNLYEKVTMTLDLEKEKILLRYIKYTYEKHLQIAEYNGESGGYSCSHLKSESSTFLDASWDLYAGFLGLEKRQCPYPSYGLEVAEEEFFKSNSYNATRIVNVIESQHGNEILNELLGPLKFIIKDPNQFIMSYLIYHKFIVPPGSFHEVVNHLKKADSQPSQYAGTLADFYRCLSNTRRNDQIIIADEEPMVPSASIPRENNNTQRPEIIILIDTSSLMVSHHSEASELNNNFWDLATQYTRSILQTELTIDEGSAINILLSGRSGESQNTYTYQKISSQDQLERFFQDQHSLEPVPLSEIFSEFYEHHLSNHLNTSIPIKFYMLTDGVADLSEVNQFISGLSNNHNSRSLAGEVEPISFGLVQIGDDHQAINFLQELDLRLEDPQTDIVDQY